MPGPDVTPVDNAATPAATNFVQFLEGLINAESLGTGVGPLQQGAGDAITNFVNTGVGRLASGGIDPGTEALIGALTTQSNRNTERQVGNLREAFGAAGTRFGTTLARGEAELRSNAQTGLDATVGSILVNQQNANRNSLLSAISEMSRQGSVNLAPFLALMAQGLPQAENVVSPSIGQQILAGLINAGATAVGGGS